MDAQELLVRILVGNEFPASPAERITDQLPAIRLARLQWLHTNGFIIEQSKYPNPDQLAAAWVVSPLFEWAWRKYPGLYDLITRISTQDLADFLEEAADE